MPAKKEPGFLTRLGEVLDGTAQKKIRRSIREQREMDARMGRAVVPVEKKRKPAKRKAAAPASNYRREVRKSVRKSIFPF